MSSKSEISKWSAAAWEDNESLKQRSSTSCVGGIFHRHSRELALLVAVSTTDMRRFKPCCLQEQPNSAGSRSECSSKIYQHNNFEQRGKLKISDELWNLKKLLEAWEWFSRDRSDFFLIGGSPQLGRGIRLIEWPIVVAVYWLVKISLMTLKQWNM